MFVGTKRHRVTILDVTNNLGDYGDANEVVLTAIGTLWARVQPVSVSERFSQGQVKGEVTHKIFLRFNSITSAITPKNRILFGAHQFDIVGVLNRDGRNREVEILARELV